MALIKCNSCGHMISDRAIKCPKCGMLNPNEKKATKIEITRIDTIVHNEEKKEILHKSKKNVIAIVLGCIIVAAIVGAYFYWNGKEKSTYDKGEMSICHKEKTETSEADTTEELPVVEEYENVAMINAPIEPKVEEMEEYNEDVKKEVVLPTDGIDDTGPRPSPPVAGPVMGPAVVVELTDEEEIFQVVEEMPEFPAGMGKMLEYLDNNIKYPTIALEQGIQGRSIIEFVVNKDGSIVDPKVVRSLHPKCDEEAMRVIKAMPKWKPGKQRGKPVRVKYTVPVTFKLP